VTRGRRLNTFTSRPEKVAAFLRSFPEPIPPPSESEVLSDPDTRLVAAAAVTSLRCDLGIRVMRAGKDYFTDKAPMTTLEQVERARACVRETGRKYLCYFAERLHTDSGVFADRLIRSGAIGRVLHIDGFGPHRLNPSTRPEWFFDKARSGGNPVRHRLPPDRAVPAHAGEEDARIDMSRTGHFGGPDHPGFEDFGDCALTGAKGATFYFRVDWFTPDGLGSWGDSRVFVIGDRGTLERRKTIDPATEGETSNVVILVDRTGEHRFCVGGKIGSPFFGQMILDCMYRTENAMSQEHCFKAAELCIRASQNALRIG
jgi:predicted dehydrogenase